MSQTQTATALASGKGDHDENFPVAALFSQAARIPVIAFYRFVRLADDVADHPNVSAAEKLHLLDEMRRALIGEVEAPPEGVQLRAVLAARGLDSVHAGELLVAFARDCTQTRYADWAELMDYCRYSAMPVGRFVLDVHGESRDLWPLSDALCAALQVINHLQDCAKDYRALDRVYLPVETLTRCEASVEMLAADRSAPPLRAVLDDLVARTDALLTQSRPFAAGIRHARLALNVAVIQTLAEDLARKLARRDPLCQRVHHRKVEYLGLFLKAFVRFLVGRLRSKRPPVRSD